MSFNSHSDERLTKSGGISFEVWIYIFRLENRCHGEPAVKDADINPDDWRDAYDSDDIAAIVLPLVEKHGDAGTAVAAMTSCLSVAAFCAEQLPQPMRSAAVAASLTVLTELLN